ncbi:hypothetical protein FF1_014976 [Malus domestica]
MLPVMSCLRQVNVFLVIEAVGQSKSEGAWVLLSEVLGLQCIMNVSSDEDHCSSFLSFVDEVVIGGFLDGGSKTLCGKMKFHALNPLPVGSSRFF